MHPALLVRFGSVALTMQCDLILSIGCSDSMQYIFVRSELQGSSLCESNCNMMNQNGKTIHFGLSRYCCNDIRNYKNNNIICMKNIYVNKNSCNRKRKLEMNNFEICH